ncbi:hypothetical protein AVEN_89862-1 [Araneus ventricosus]|nr:hypothetical protein AVEN_31919-1 [Araneus ventricosus]GBN68967.1 hypothetical protein AVEN_89862-1 [Araneus ventricosus]
MMPNQLKIVSTILSRLENRLLLLRHTLSEAKETGNLSAKFTTKKSSSIMDESNQLTVHPTTVEYTLVFDCCDIEAAVNRISNELAETGSFETLKAVVREYEEASAVFEKHKKILESKRQSIAEHKKLLAAIREKQEPLQKVYEAAPRKKSELSEDNLSLVKQWMECRIESKKEFYEYLVGEVREKTENFETESRMQVHTDFQAVSFWLLKYESFIQTLDLLLRKIFDEWASKKREISVLKKYRNFNLEKIERITKQVRNSTSFYILENDLLFRLFFSFREMYREKPRLRTARQ